MNTYPRTIEDGNGEQLTFVRQYDDAERGTVLEISGVTGPGAGPPMHVHNQQYEKITVTSGRMGVELAGGEKLVAEAGESVEFAPGEPHRFWNDGEEPLVSTGEVWPAGNFEWYITQVFASMAEAGNGRPKPFDGAFLSHKYRSEFETLQIPAPVRKVVFPAIVAVGGALGKARKFEGAPAPVRSAVAA